MSNADLKYIYYSNPTALMKLGFVRVATIFTPTLSFSVTNYTHFHRVIEGGTISAIRMYVGVSSGNICIAIYKSSGSGVNATPGNQVASTGSIACPATTGINEIPLGKTVKVAAGDWISFGADNSTATFSGANGPGLSGMSYGIFHGQGVFPAPAVANAGNNNSRMFGLVGVP